MSADLKQQAEEKEEIIALFTMSCDDYYIDDNDMLLFQQEAQNLHIASKQKVKMEII